jgi:phospholipid/cholesterol/gamma-HCH transport system ATP-binding protein
MIEFIDVYKSFGSFRVLQGMNLAFPKGKTTVILGRSGTGKSVTIKHILGFLKPDKGTIMIDGEDTGSFSAKKWRLVRQKMGVSFQSSALFDSMNIFNNVLFPLKEHSKESYKTLEKIAIEKLELVGLKEHIYKMPSELSGGMQKRAALARAIALDPEIVLFDEPTSGLDPIVTAVIDDLVKKTQEHTKCTFIIISHDIQSTFRVADKIALLYQGKIIAKGDAKSFQNSSNPLVQQFIHGSLDGDFKIK